jgi:hypothetical protein
MPDYTFEYIDAKGTIIRQESTPRFQEVENGDFSDGRALFRTGNDQYGYIDRDGAPVIPAQFSAALEFSDGRAAIKISDRWGYIDTRQQTVINPQFISAESFSENLAPVRQNGNQWGYADERGVIAIAPQFEEARPFREGRAAVLVGEKWGFVDTRGNAILAPTFDDVQDFNNGLARVRVDVGEDESRYGYVDKNGSYVWYPTD